MQQIYLDYNATSPCCDEALEASLPFFRENYGNALSGHQIGAVAGAALQRGREQIADLLGAAPERLIFGSGGTEAINHAIKGLAFGALKSGPKHILMSATEHHAAEESVFWLEALGFSHSILPVDGQGRVNPEDVRRGLEAQPTLCVVVMHANNEVGTLQPASEIGKICREYGVPYICDVVQSLGKVPIDIARLNADLVPLSAHKFYGPKGFGALYVREGLSLVSLLHGARHESGQRAGTHNVAGAVGAGRAAELAQDHADEAHRQGMAALRDHLEGHLVEHIPGALVHGGEADRLPNTLNISFDGVLAQDLLITLKAAGIAASAGAACRSGQPIPSHTLLAMGLPRERALGGVRFSLGRYTTKAMIEMACERITGAVLAAKKG